MSKFVVMQGQPKGLTSSFAEPPASGGLLEGLAAAVKSYDADSWKLAADAAAGSPARLERITAMAQLSRESAETNGLIPASNGKAAAAKPGMAG